MVTTSSTFICEEIPHLIYVFMRQSADQWTLQIEEFHC